MKSDFNYHLLNEGLDSSNFPLETSRPYNIQNLDKFLSKVYNYYAGKGFWCILVAKALNLLSLLWVLGLVVFLVSCVDWEVLFQANNLNDAIHYRGLHPLLIICLIIFCIFWVWQFRGFVIEIWDNIEMRQFFQHELHVTESELQTMQWREVVQKLLQFPHLCITKDRMTHLDIANRIMRKENYLIALINKEILNLEIPLPIIRSRQVVTKTLEWGLSLAIFSYVFDNRHVDGLNRQILDPHRSKQLAEGLRRRFVLMGIISFILSPFIFIFLIIYFIFKYGEEVHSRPGSFASRQWSPLARWKFRELNELPHVFQKRLNASYTIAEKYVSSFHLDIIAIVARFVSFIGGSLLVVFLAIGLWDDDALFKMVIYQDKSAFWFVGVLGSIVAGCRAVIPNENEVAEPDKIMEDLVQHTHYMPKSWRGKTHTNKVLDEFTQLFQYKIVIFLTEIFSVLFAPLILMFSLPKSAENIIQFFREYTITESGVGDVCKFAVFPLEEHGSRTYGVSTSAPKKLRTKQGKMEKSFLSFKANYPDWQPGVEGEKYLSSLSHAITASDPTAQNFVNSSPSFLGSVIHSDPNTFGRGNPYQSSENNLGMSVMSDRQMMEESMSSLHKVHRYFLHSSDGVNPHLPPSSFSNEHHLL